MIVLGIDPGAKGAGYCLWHSTTCVALAVANSLITGAAPDAIVIESGFIGRMGRKAMWGLGFDAGWRLHEAWLANFAISPELYTIRPDGPLGWRAALPPRPDLPAALRFAQYDGLPGDVIVNRLRVRYGLLSQATNGGGHTEHEVEAVGIAEAAAAILQRPKASQRKALVRVKR